MGKQYTVGAVPKYNPKIPETVTSYTRNTYIHDSSFYTLNTHTDWVYLVV